VAAGVSNLPDAERDACDVVQVLANLAALLARPLPGEAPAADQPDPAMAEARRLLLHLAEDGGAAAERVVAYLRSLRGRGDGEAVAVAPHLGPWREWVPPRGHLFGSLGTNPRIGELPESRRADPGE
jgi:hypothetical protein